jgi:TrmH family RNA methyltransferase
MITSPKNARVQWVRGLQRRARDRRQESAFVIEGVRLGEEALAAGWEALLVLHTEDLPRRGLAVAEAFAARGAPVEAASPAVMAAACDTETPAGLLAVLRLQEQPAPPALDFVLIADGVRDPGNLGTMLRTAAAAGVQAVFLPPGSADAYAPKVVRAAMGAHFRLPVLAEDWAALRGRIERSGLHLYLAAAGEGLPYTAADFRAPTALLIGGEAQGAGDEARRLAPRAVHIPMPGGMESLNAAAAAAVLVFEVVRQRAASTQEG